MMTVDTRGPRACSSSRRVCIETYGCSYNVSDSEAMAGLLDRAGYMLVASPADADAIVVNSCTVKGKTIREFCKRVRALAVLPQRPVLVIAGCIPAVPQYAQDLTAFAQIGPNDLDGIVEVVEAALAGRRLSRISRIRAERLALPRRRRNRAIEIVPISQGCLGSCTFCQTLIARGRLHSYPPEAILNRIRDATAHGVRQVWLTSQDAGAYGGDIGVTLPMLLRQIEALPGDFRVRLGMANPDFVMKFAAQLAEILKSPRFYHFAHIPVQSGSDAVLTRMGRGYTRDEFLRIVETMRSAIPDLTLATDVIVGFPGETDEDFAATIDVLQQVATPVINRSRFSARPGTRAARLEPLPTAVISERSKQLCTLAQDLAFRALQRWTGWRGNVIVEEELRPGVYLARNHAYTPVIIEGMFIPGSEATIEVVRVDGFHVCGQVPERCRRAASSACGKPGCGVQVAEAGHVA